jgi:pimeloyl-ACP methyl ester carboxylesterase
MNPFHLDCTLYRNKNKTPDSRESSSEFIFIQTPFGKVRAYDSGSNKPTLLMVPDGPCFLEHFAELIQAASAKWRVVVFDMPGFGRSFPQNGYNHSFEHASAVIKAVHDKLNLKSATLAFSCANGFYAIDFAIKFPANVARVLLMQTPSLAAMTPWGEKNIPWPVRIPYLGQLAVYAQRMRIPWIWFKSALPKASPHLQTYSQTSCHQIASGACNCLASVVQGLSKMDETQLLGAQVPVDLIWGARDFSHRMTRPDSLRTLVPHAKIEIWEDVGHFPNLEQPQRFLDFLDSRSDANPN